MTYHIDTPIPRDGHNSVERTEIDTWRTQGRVSNMVSAHGDRNRNLPTTLMLGCGKMRGTGRNGRLCKQKLNGTSSVAVGLEKGMV